MKVRHDAADTSVQAAQLAAPRAGTQRARIITCLASAFNGLTDAQLQVYLAMPESSERPRRVELVEQGWVEDSGDRRRFGRHSEAIVWQLTVAARSSLKSPGTVTPPYGAGTPPVEPEHASTTARLPGANSVEGRWAS